MTAPASLQKCLSSVLERSLVNRYIRSSADFSMSARDYYNAALKDLNAKDSEGAIHHLIMSLSSENNHEPSLHLVKTMLFGLSKKFAESGGETWKQRFGTLGKWILHLEKQVTDIDKNILILKNQKLKEKEQGLWLFLAKLFFPKKFESIENKIVRMNTDKENLKKQIMVATKIAQMEEYAKVLSLILEICLYPARYSWVVL